MTCEHGLSATGRSLNTDRTFFDRSSFRISRKAGFALSGSGLLSAMLIFLPVTASAGADLVAEPVDATRLVALSEHRVSWATAKNDMGEVADNVRLSHLTIVLNSSAQRELEDLLHQQQDPNSANFHHWLSPTEFGERFGASVHDIQAVTSWLQSQGLHVDAVSNSRLRIDVSGSAANVGAALGSRLHVYQVSKEQRIAPVSVPQIPAALSTIVRSVRGLATIKEKPSGGFGVAQFVGQAAGGSTSCSTNSCTHYIFPADFATLYDVNPIYQQGIDGSGQTIAIIGRARVYLPDVENFQARSGLATKDPTIIVPPTGIDPGPAASSGGVSEDQLEATIDVTRATSVAPGATVDLVISADAPTGSGLGIAAEYVVDNRLAEIMNISFGACEASAGQSGVAFWDSLFSQAAAEGISVFVVSGDSGAAGCDAYNTTPPATQTVSPNYICASSYATCVGGTQFADTGSPGAYWSSSSGAGLASALRYIPEGAWNEPMGASGSLQASASGGGVSMYVPTPSWQSGLGPPGEQGRFTPDVSFSASAHNGYFACLAAAGNSCVSDATGYFQFEYFFGASAATADMAGIAALLNQKIGTPQGNLNSRLYALAATPGSGVFHDVTVSTSSVSGCDVSAPSMCNNSTPGPGGLDTGVAGYLVRTGYDEVTGLGSIDAANLLARWFAVPGSTEAQTIPSGQTTNYQGLWWAAPAGSESGWGINFAHQGNTIFASWFTYDLTGKGLWLVMTAGQTAPNTYSGTLYTTTGPGFNAAQFNPNQVVPSQVGTGTLTFRDANDATFAYTVEGVSQVKNIEREVFGKLPICATATGPLTAATNYTDLWWASPPGSESGWGINLTHEGTTIFATWFTYGTDGTPMWLVVTAGNTGPGVYSGTLYQTTGPAFDAVPFNPANVVPAAVGTATFTFADGNDATFAYTVNDISQQKAITREVFQAPGTVCQ